MIAVINGVFRQCLHSCNQQKYLQVAQFLGLKISDRQHTHGLKQTYLADDYLSISAIAGKWHLQSAGTSVMPNMLHCQITCSMRFARRIGIMKPNPELWNLTLTLQLTLTLKP